MTLDEAIKHCEEVAENCEEQAKQCDSDDRYERHVMHENAKCAAEHRQLAEWLRELKERREADTQPLFHAYWIRGKEFGFRTHNPMWYCSNCGGGIRYDTTLRTYQKKKDLFRKSTVFAESAVL